MKKLILLFLFLLLLGCCGVVYENLAKEGEVRTMGAVSDISAEALADKYDKADDIKNKYKLENTALKMIAKNDPKDMVRVTVGNETAELGAVGEFEPSVKISRWDEVSFKIKPTGLDNIKSKDKKLSLDKNKIKFDTPKVEYNLYDLPTSEELPEGGFEFEVILKERPTNNVVEFEIEAEGLDFYYQPALTKEWQSGWNEEYQREVVVSDTDVKDLDGNILIHRPENVVGAYVIYTSEDKTNWVGGKSYKTGKMGIFYRPKIIDSIGIWCWGKLNVDIEKRSLSVEIPQEFLNNAVYPIRHAAGLTLGFAGIGVSTYNWGGVNYIVFTQKTSTSDVGNVDTLHHYLNNDDNGAGNLKIALYTDSAGNATNLIDYTNNIAVANNFLGWKSDNGTQAAPIAGTTTYHIGFIHDVINMNWFYDTVASGLGYVGYQNVGSFTLPNPANPETGWSGVMKMSSYVTYSAEVVAEEIRPGQNIFFD